MSRELIKTIKYKAGYHVRHEMIDGDEAGGGEPFVLKSAQTPEGLYIGDKKMAEFLMGKRGIMPELARSDCNVCSVGFCEEENKWYGWSHRAIAGFGIGNRIFEENWPKATEDTPFVEHGSDPIESMEDARWSAVRFAKYVS